MALHDMDGGIWQEYGRNGLKQTSLAQMLGDMGAARPKNVKTEGQVQKGHEVSDLLEVCARYASPLGGAQNATPLPGNNYAAKTVADDETLPATKALPPELEPKSPENAPGSGVAFPAPPNPKEEKMYEVPAPDPSKPCPDCGGPTIATGYGERWCNSCKQTVGRDDDDDDDADLF